MGFRFRKTIKLFPGFRINVSKSGISTSIGVRGATVNIGKHGTRGIVGIPGTGVSYSEKLSDARPREFGQQPLSTIQSNPPTKSRTGLTWFLVFAVLGVLAIALLR